MTSLKILVTAEVNIDIIKEIESYGEVLYEGWGKHHRKLTEDEIIELAEDKDILITSYDPVTSKVIDSCKNLKLIACTRSNPVNIDMHYARKKGIQVIFAPGRNSDSTAEFTIAMMLNISRYIPNAYMELKSGKHLSENSFNNTSFSGLQEDVTWDLRAGSPYVTFKGMQLKGHILGIIGYGDIGRRVSKIAAAFGMKIYVYDPFMSFININDNIVQKVTFDKLLEESDFVSCHCKVNEKTRGLIGKNEFKKMKKTSYFINSSRGAIVDETALIEALRNKEIAGAALDVFESEPLYKEHPFIKELDNVLVTPHLAGATYDAIDNHSHMVVEDVKNFINNEKLIYEYK